jgi:hypothetical protein
MHPLFLDIPLLERAPICDLRLTARPFPLEPCFEHCLHVIDISGGPAPLVRRDTGQWVLAPPICYLPSVIFMAL